MRYSTQIKPISYLKNNIADIVDAITESGEPMIVTQNGEPTFVVMDIKSYEDSQQREALLRILALGQQQIKKGEFMDSDEFFAKMDKDIAG